MSVSAAIQKHDLEHGQDVDEANGRQIKAQRVDGRHVSDFMIARRRRECHGIFKANRSPDCICDQGLQHGSVPEGEATP